MRATPTPLPAASIAAVFAVVLAACSPSAPRAPAADPATAGTPGTAPAPGPADADADADADASGGTPPGPQAAAAPVAGAAADPCDWTTIALPRHRAMAEATPQALLDTLADADAGGDVAPLRALLQRPALALGTIDGAWRVRSLQFDGQTVYAYPYFQARMSANDCGHAFAKTTGSQRRSGVLYPVAGDDTRLAFLGASTVNDDPPRDYEPARSPQSQRFGEENSAGVLYRIGADELVMLLDADPEGRFEVYHLRR